LGVTVQALFGGTLPPSGGLEPHELAKLQYRFMGVMERARQRQRRLLAAWLDQRPPKGGPMIAAIYARKSTDQHLADEAKSVTRHIKRRAPWTIRAACRSRPQRSPVLT
jgi:hypothetical protein